MLIIGLTGSIGMGKSATAAMFARRGVPVFDADAAVHALYESSDAHAIETAFPGVLVDGKIDRTQLAARVLGKPDELARLEKIVHPLVRDRENAFLDTAFASHARACVLEVPLLLESGADRRCDLVAVVSASAEIQRQRVLDRSGMDVTKLEAILARQMSDADKRARAHVVIPTGSGFAAAEKAVADLLRATAAMPGNIYANRKAAG